MTKSVLLTIPVSSETELRDLTPYPDALGLTEVNPLLVYGFHGNPTAKGDVMSACYERALKKNHSFYVTDITFKAPEGFDQTLLEGHLDIDHVNEVPFLITKRISRRLSQDIGDLWQKWAAAHYGAARVRAADVDWGDTLSFIPAFPYVADRLFEHFPNLRCAVIPVRMDFDNLPTPLTWVGVTLRSTAESWISTAEVRRRSKVNVNLKF